MLFYKIHVRDWDVSTGKQGDATTLPRIGLTRPKECASSYGNLTSEHITSEPSL